MRRGMHADMRRSQNFAVNEIGIPESLRALRLQVFHRNSTLIVQLSVRSCGAKLAAVRLLRGVASIVATIETADLHTQQSLNFPGDTSFLENLGKTWHAYNEEAAGTFGVYPEDKRAESIHLIRVVAKGNC